MADIFGYGTSQDLRITCKLCDQTFAHTDSHQCELSPARALERIKSAYLDMLSQACGEWEPAHWESDENGHQRCVREAKFKGYDSMCLSSYESALDVAVEMGWIKKEEVLR